MSVQRAQDVETWSAVDESCAAFDAAKVHMGGMTDAACSQITTEQYGAALVPGQTWGDAGASEIWGDGDGVVSWPIPGTDTPPFSVGPCVKNPDGGMDC